MVFTPKFTPKFKLQGILMSKTVFRRYFHIMALQCGRHFSFCSENFKRLKLCSNLMTVNPINEDFVWNAPRISFFINRSNKNNRILMFT